MRAFFIALAVSFVATTTLPRPSHVGEGRGGVCVLFTGDILLDRGVASVMRRSGNDYVWQDVDSLFHTADAVVVNLECPVTTHSAPVNKKFVFRANPGALPSMRRAGVTHAALANNHTMDQGARGLRDTDSLLRAEGITPLGIGKKPRAVMVAPGVAVMNALQMPVENWSFEGQYANVCCASTDTLVAAVERFRRQHPTTRLVVLLHWGGEYQRRCTPRQCLDAHRLIDAGADAVVGHHPHVLQNHEVYHGRPIYYSLGNFIFDNRRPETCSTAVLQLTFSSGKVSATLHPYTIRDCRPTRQPSQSKLK